MLTGVKQGCLLSPFLFLLCIDWTMKHTTYNKKTGFQWSLKEQLEDLDFADDIALLSHSHQEMQEKSQLLEETAAALGLNINGLKTKVMQISNKSTNPIIIVGQTLEEVNKFTSLGSAVPVDGGTEEDVKARIGKARATFNILIKIWKTTPQSIQSSKSLTRTSNPYCYMDQRPGGPPITSLINCRLLSATA